eukprot:jgi/Tetstr1/452749/TSEL_039785.t1
MAYVLGALAVMDNGIIVADFTNRLWRGIKAFSSKPSDTPKIDAPPDEDARDIKEFTRPLLGKSGAQLGIKHAKYERSEGSKRVVVEYDFDEAELNRAAINIDKALEAPAASSKDDKPNEHIKREVMLFMDQAKRGPGKEKGRTGDKGIVPDVSDKPLPVYFRKSFQDIKDQMIRDVNPLTSTFVVDVLVQYVGDEPKGYIVIEVHQAISGEDE